MREKKIWRDRQKNRTTPLFSSPPSLHPSHPSLFFSYDDVQPSCAKGFGLDFRRCPLKTNRRIFKIKYKRTTLNKKNDYANVFMCNLFLFSGEVISGNVDEDFR